MATSPQAEMQEYTVTLRKEVVDIVRAKVSSGEYASEGDFLEAAIVDITLPLAPAPGLEHWVKTEGVRRLDYLKAHPESGFTPEQMDAFLDEDDADFAPLQEAG